jgi:hypothetical protein
VLDQLVAEARLEEKKKLLGELEEWGRRLAEQREKQLDDREKVGGDREAVGGEGKPSCGLPIGSYARSTSDATRESRAASRRDYQTKLFCIYSHSLSRCPLVALC